MISKVSLHAFSNLGDATEWNVRLHTQNADDYTI